MTTPATNVLDVVNPDEEEIYEVDPNHPARPMEVVPLGYVFALRIEDLDSVVFAVRYVDVPVRVRADAVDEIEFPRIGTRLTPRKEQLSIRRILMDPCVAVPVGDVEFAGAGIQGNLGRQIEGLPALKGSGPQGKK